MKKLSLLILSLCIAAVSFAAEPVDAKYLAGAVPEVNGHVVFLQTYTLPGQSASSIYAAVRSYVEDALVQGPEHGIQARITEDSASEGILAASIQETLWFLRRPMRSDFADFYYQVVAEVHDGSLTLTLRNLRYVYRLSDREEDIATFRAEEWITDKKCLSKKGDKLQRHNGKFRIGTIDRVQAVFRDLGALLKG